MKKYLFTLTIILFGFMVAQAQTIIFLSANQPTELKAYAGDDSGIGTGESVTLGKNPSVTGGVGPYTYSWSDGSTVVSTEANPSVEPSGNTIYTLKVTDNNTCMATDNIFISIGVTAINDFTEDELKIYPNPVSDMFTIEAIGKTTTVTLINKTGKTLWTKPLKGKTNFAAPGTPGIYLLRIKDGDKESIRKIIITN